MCMNEHGKFKLHNTDPAECPVCGSCNVIYTVVVDLLKMISKGTIKAKCEECKYEAETEEVADRYSGI